MAIIRYTKENVPKYHYLNIFPDQFKTEKEKQNPTWIKNTMDYFANRAYAEYVKNREGFVKNYDLVKGILRPEDFYQEPDVKSFTEMLEQSLELPNYVKHYSILSTPINNLVGEISKRPDTFRVKAFDDESRSEELQFKTDLLQKFVISQAKMKIMEQAAMEGVEINPQDLEQMTMEQVKDELDDYTSAGEKWANHMVNALKMEFNIKEQSEEAMRDLCISAREFYHIYEDNSKLGFNVKTENPKNVWLLTTPDKKYTSDPSGRNSGVYAGGTVHVMELSEIIETFPDLTKEEIDHLRAQIQDYGLINVRESNLGNPDVPPGINSITYDTYDPLVLQERMLIESDMKENNDGLRDFLGLTSNVSAFGYKYVVVRSYWISKKKIGKVTYIDPETMMEVSELVDESYKSGDIPSQISLEWGWMNIWYQGDKIGPDVYHVKPLKILNYFPIIGTIFELKNTEARSLVDLMKPFQVIYNICMNQLYRLLEKEIGNVGSINVRRIPKVKDGDEQDAIDIWEMEARERGIIFDDDSPENTKAPVTNTSVARNIDLTRTNEIQSRYNLAVMIKNECWELIGITRQRLGSTHASESATGVNTAVTQSYAQTEPLFVAHEYVLQQLHQAMLDAAQYIESSKEESTISYVTSEGQSAFLKISGADLSMRDFFLYPTNRPEDNEMYKEIRALSQAVLQNGGTLYDIVELYSTKSLRELKKTFRNLRDQAQEMLKRDQEIKERDIQQRQAASEAALAQNAELEQQRIANENYQNELDRINKKEVALINALRFNENAGADTNNDGIADALQVANLTNDQQKAQQDFNLAMKEMNAKATEAALKAQVEREKLQVARENMKNDLEIAKLNAKGRGAKK